MSINSGAHTQLQRNNVKLTKDEKLAQHREWGSWGYTGNLTTHSRQHAVDPLSSDLEKDSHMGQEQDGVLKTMPRSSSLGRSSLLLASEQWCEKTQGPEGQQGCQIWGCTLSSQSKRVRDAHICSEISAMVRFWQTPLVLKFENSGFRNLGFLLSNDGLKHALEGKEKWHLMWKHCCSKACRQGMHKGYPAISIRLAWIRWLESGLNTKRLFR